VLGADAYEAQQRRIEINGNERTFYCGAYWGMGGHEDGFRSGIDAAERLLEKLPELTRRTGATNESDYSVDVGNADQRQGG
jgi:predicted NAD/FAD-binding protein